MANDFKWSAEKVLQHLMKSVRAGDIVVFHDSHKAEKVVLEVLPEFIFSISTGFTELISIIFKCLDFRPLMFIY